MTTTGNSGASTLISNVLNVPNYTLAGLGGVPSRSQSNWNDGTVINNVIGILAWKNYGNGHVIFDASEGTSPSGTAVNQTNATNAWVASFPTLMGWNGVGTYGVRVDSARVADTAPSYLPLAGGDMTGQINFANNLGTCLFGQMGDSDQWRIYAGNTGSNAGYLEIATSDDGSEPIYVRQYTGVFGSLVRTAKLLDESGNTIFPGYLGAFNFSGTSSGTNTGDQNLSGLVPYTGATTNVDLATHTMTASAFYESSDIRYKDVIEKNPQLDVLGIDVIKFTRTDDDTNAIRYGYSAQQVQSILPDAVSGNEKLSVNYMDVHTLKIASLEKRIAELEAKLNKYVI